MYVNSYYTATGHINKEPTVVSLIGRNINRKYNWQTQLQHKGQSQQNN